MTLKAFRLAKLDSMTIQNEVFIPDPRLAAQASDEESVWFGEKMEVVLTVGRSFSGSAIDAGAAGGERVGGWRTDCVEPGGA